MRDAVPSGRALETQGLEPRPVVLFDRDGARLVHRRRIVMHDQLAILRHAHVEFDAVAARLERRLETRYGVLPRRHREAAMTDQEWAGEPDPGKNVGHEATMGGPIWKRSSPWRGMMLGPAP